MIRAKKIEYLESPSIAVYFQNMTQQVEKLRLESKLLAEKNRNSSLESYTSTISHEFRTPLGTSLMFLEQMLNEMKLNKSSKRVIGLVVS